METPWARVGDAVRAARKAQDLTQAELGARANVSTATIRAIERGTEYGSVTLTLRSVEAALSWAPGSVQAILDGGQPTTQYDVAAGAPAEPTRTTTDGLPLRVARALTEGTTLDTTIVPLSPGAEMVVIVKGKPSATPDEIRAALLAWEEREGHLDRLGDVADEPSDKA